MSAIRGTVEINTVTCKGCELCIEACPQGSLALSKDVNKLGYHYSVLVQDNCTGCVNCALVCPDAVITVYRMKKNSSGKGSRRETVAIISNVKSDIRIELSEVPQGGVSI